MTDYEHPHKMTNDELAEFARNEHINHKIGCSYTNGVKVVDAIYREIAQRIVFLADSVQDIERDNAALRKGMVAQCHCKHFKGLHPNDYADCLVVCDKFDDDYVSMASCQCCKEFELTTE